MPLHFSIYLWQVIDNTYSAMPCICIVQTFSSTIRSLVSHNQGGVTKHFARRAIGEVVQLASCYNRYRVVAEKELLGAPSSALQTSHPNAKQRPIVITYFSSVTYSVVKTPTIFCLLMFPGIIPTLKDMLLDNKRRCGARSLLRMRPSFL